MYLDKLEQLALRFGFDNSYGSGRFDLLPSHSSLAPEFDRLEAIFLGKGSTFSASTSKSSDFFEKHHILQSSLLHENQGDKNGATMEPEIFSIPYEIR